MSKNLLIWIKFRQTKGRVNKLMQNTPLHCIKFYYFHIVHKYTVSHFILTLLSVELLNAASHLKILPKAVWFEYGFTTSLPGSPRARREGRRGREGRDPLRAEPRGRADRRQVRRRQPRAHRGECCKVVRKMSCKVASFQKLMTHFNRVLS